MQTLRHARKTKIHLYDVIKLVRSEYFPEGPVCFLNTPHLECAVFHVNTFWLNFNLVFQAETILTSYSLLHMGKTEDQITTTQATDFLTALDSIKIGRHCSLSFSLISLSFSDLSLSLCDLSLSDLSLRSLSLISALSLSL